MEKITTQKIVPVERDAEHSMEFVATINGVSYINDSKSITAKSSAENINSIDNDLVLIIGGDDSKTDYSWFSFLNYYNIKTVIYYGRRIAEIKNIFSKHVMVILVENLESAVNVSKVKSISNQVVLFTPACPSYDAFDNYKNRGTKFKSYVNNLK